VRSESVEREPVSKAPFFPADTKPSFTVDDDVLDIPSFLRDR